MSRMYSNYSIIKFRYAWNNISLETLEHLSKEILQSSIDKLLLRYWTTYIDELF